MIGSCAKCLYVIVSTDSDSTPSEKVAAYNATRVYNMLVNICTNLGLANITAYENTAPPNGTTAVTFVAKSGEMRMQAGDHWALAIMSAVVGVLALGSIC